MQLTTSKKTLLYVLGLAAKAVNPKAINEALRNVLFTAEKPDLMGPGRIRVEGTDLFMSMSANVVADVDSPGAIVLPAKELLDRMNVMPDGQITIAQVDDRIDMRGPEKRRFGLKGFSPETFTANATIPQPPTDAPSITIPADTLLKAIARTFFAVHTDETHVKSTALTEWGTGAGGFFRMVSFGGHQLSVSEIRGLGFTTTASMLIPRKGLDLIRQTVEFVRNAMKGRPLAEGETAKPLMVKLVHSGSKVFVLCENVTISIALFAEQKFAPYENVLTSRAREVDAASNSGAIVPRARLMDGLKAMSVACHDQTVRMQFVPGFLTLSADTEVGKGIDEIAIDYIGKPHAVSIDVLCALAQLAVFDCDAIFLGLGKEQPSPMLFWPDPAPDGEKDFSMTMLQTLIDKRNL